MANDGKNGVRSEEVEKIKVVKNNGEGMKVRRKGGKQRGAASGFICCIRGFLGCSKKLGIESTMWLYSCQSLAVTRTRVYKSFLLRPRQRDRETVEEG